MPRALVLTTALAGLLIANTAKADLLDNYERSWDHVITHAGRGATDAEIAEANKELDWINSGDNAQHLQKFLHWLLELERLNHENLKNLSE